VPHFGYYRRIFSAYILGGNSHLTFWHETPTENPHAQVGELGEYYMLFAEKADYKGAYDAAGIPLLDYHGHIGPQYNPIAIAQYGLGNYNLWKQSADPKNALQEDEKRESVAPFLPRPVRQKWGFSNDREKKFFLVADWLTAHLEQNAHGRAVWNHHFDWEYRETLKAPWYSALAQGQGISVLVRAHKESGDARYLDAARLAFASFEHSIDEGGVAFTDASGDLWFEEYIVSPPTHILNGFIWALWGVYDYFLATRENAAHDLFSRGVCTLLHDLSRFDLGFWSLYEQSGTRLPMVASAFYHRLHIVQLRVVHRLTGEPEFARVADRWENYTRSRINRTRAFLYKSAFKLCYY